MSLMNDPHNLKRFMEAQDPVYDRVCAELRSGQKTSHWMWFIFPQLRGLGHSLMASEYGISSKEEAVAYLQHPILGERLRECTRLVNSAEGRSASELFGYPDNLKFRSSMTLFANVAPQDQVFKQALQKYFDGEPDRLTLQLL